MLSSLFFSLRGEGLRQVSQFCAELSGGRDVFRPSFLFAGDGCGAEFVEDIYGCTWEEFVEAVKALWTPKGR
jgi:hypothetical protein